MTTTTTDIAVMNGWLGDDTTLQWLVSELQSKEFFCTARAERDPARTAAGYVQVTLFWSPFRGLKEAKKLQFRDLRGWGSDDTKWRLCTASATPGGIFDVWTIYAHCKESYMKYYNTGAAWSCSYCQLRTQTIFLCVSFYFSSIFVINTHAAHCRLANTIVTIKDCW